MEFGRLTIIEVDEDSKINGEANICPSDWKYSCKCSCPSGSIRSIRRADLVGNKTKSCGCLQKEAVRKTHIKNHKINIAEDCGAYIKIYFFNCDDYAIIDKENYDKVKSICWFRVAKANTYYAVANIPIDQQKFYGKKTIMMHQILCPSEKGHMPDHKDGNGLNNINRNLRPTTRSQNNMNRALMSNNTSGIAGVVWNDKQKRWIARIGMGAGRKHLGSFIYKKDAIKVRKEAEERYFNKHSFDNSRGKGE
jgi:hypothetical protein